jgi:tetratricopeptide (TPR) repeat protein
VDEPGIVDKWAVLRPSTLPLITLIWLAGVLSAFGAIRAAIATDLGLTGALAALALVCFAIAFAVQRIWRSRFSAALVAAEDALDRGELERAREIAAPLLARFPKLAVVQEVAADVLYASGDPLSAASLFESAMKVLGRERVAPRLVACYAALNRGGDARRVAALVPEDRLASLALAWSELVATGGDRARGLALADSLVSDVERSENSTVAAMTAAVAAIAAARRGDGVGVGARLAAMRRATPTTEDAAFLGYLAGVALREAGELEDARREFSAAVERSPGSIGGALARRERANLQG